MKLVLLGAANPRVCSLYGPTVRLREGKWKIHCEGVVDSELFLHSGLVGTPVVLPNSHEFDGKCSVNVGFDKRGTEPFISVYAELVK